MKPKILLVDDEEDIRFLLEHALSANFEIYGAGSGADAQRIALEITPDMIICDYQLGDTDGLTLIQKLQQSFPNAKYMLLTGLLFDPATSQEIRGKYSLSYLSKTTPLRQIMKEVQEIAGVAAI